jgi:hypothetical protein
VARLQEFKSAVEPKIEHNTGVLIDLQSQQTSRGKMFWVAAIVVSAIVGAITTHVIDALWKIS